MTSWQKAIKYVAMAFAIFLSVSIIGGILSIFKTFDFLFGQKDVVGDMQTYNISSEITELDIDISVADFAIKTDDDFRVESNHKYLTVEEKNGCLVISEEERFWSSDAGKVKIELYIPEDTVFDKADIVTGAGVVSVTELSADRLLLELGAGEVNIKKLTAADRAEIEGGAGSVTINGGRLHNVNLDMGVGELKLTSRLTGESKLNYGVGATNLVLLGSSDDYRIEIDKGLGEAKIDGEKMDNGNVYGFGENKVDIDGGVGEIKVSFSETED